MDFCEQNDIDFVFGLSGNGTLDHAVEIVADDIRTRRALAQAPVLRGCYAETMYRAKSWSKSPRACARIEATSPGLDIPYVVTSLAAGSAEHIYAYLCQISRNAGQAKIAFSVHCAKLHRLPAALPLGLFRSEVRQIRWRGRIRRTRSRMVR
jgi:hypothetical protein